jgi:hypothetical protein
MSHFRTTRLFGIRRHARRSIDLNAAKASDATFDLKAGLNGQDVLRAKWRRRSDDRLSDDWRYGLVKSTDQPSLLSVAEAASRL